MLYVYDKLLLPYENVICTWDAYYSFRIVLYVQYCGILLTINNNKVEICCLSWLIYVSCIHIHLNSCVTHM